MPDPSTPLVSIVTPVLNARPHVERCLASVAAQDYPRIDHVIIDGGSTDGTLEVIRAHEKRLGFWLSAPDRSTAAAFNKGVAAAKGDVIGFLNADDWFETDAVSRAVAQLDTAAADFTYGTVQVHGPSGILGCIRPLAPERWADACLFEMPVPHISMFVRRAVLDRIGPFDERCRFTSDHDQFIRLNEGGFRGVELPGVIGHVQVGGKADSAVSLLESYRIAARHGAPALRRNARLARNLSVYLLRKGAARVLGARRTAILLQRAGSRHGAA